MKLRIALLPVVFAVAACGGASPAPRTAAPPREAPEAEPRTVEDAQDSIARAKAELETNSKTESKVDDRRAEPQADRDAPSPKPTDERAGASKQAERATTPCAKSCRALESMRRAVDALCRMAGDDDRRCVDARTTLDASVARVASCRC